jgi:Uma2 family endonuclease
MVSSSSKSLQNLATDTWVKASWEDFLALADDSTYANGRFYYHQGYLRIEMSPLGPRHGRQNGISTGFGFLPRFRLESTS